MSAERTQLNIQLDESQKRRWEEGAESYGDFESLSQMVRYCVENELRRRDSDETDIEEVHKSLSDQIDEVNRSIGRLIDTVDELDDNTVGERDMQEFADGMLRAVLLETLDEVGVNDA